MSAVRRLNKFGLYPLFGVVKFIDENLYKDSHIDSVKEAIQIRRHLNNIIRDSRINTNAYNQTSTAQQLIGTRANC